MVSIPNLFFVCSLFIFMVHWATCEPLENGRKYKTTLSPILESDTLSRDRVTLPDIIIPTKLSRRNKPTKPPLLPSESLESHHQPTIPWHSRSTHSVMSPEELLDNLLNNHNGFQWPGDGGGQH